MTTIAPGADIHYDTGGRAGVREVRCSEFATELIKDFDGPVRP